MQVVLLAYLIAYRTHLKKKKEKKQKKLTKIYAIAFVTHAVLGYIKDGSNDFAGFTRAS